MALFIPGGKHRQEVRQVVGNSFREFEAWNLLIYLGAGPNTYKRLCDGYCSDIVTTVRTADEHRQQAMNQCETVMSSYEDEKKINNQMVVKVSRKGNICRCSLLLIS